MDAARSGDTVAELQRKIEELQAEVEDSRRKNEELVAELGRKEAQLGRTRQAQEEIRGVSEQLERQAMILERDTQVARELQKSLEPVWVSDIETVQFAIKHKSGARVGGDFCDVIRLPENCIAFLIADVSGFGLPAAVLMATARMAFRTFSSNELSPLTILQKVNQAMLSSTLAGHYLSAFLGVLDTELLNLQYANASHHPPFLVRPDGVTALDTEGICVGMFEEPQYEQKSIQLDKGDKLLLFTDGLLRQFEETGEEKPREYLLKFLEQNSAKQIAEIVDQLATRGVEQPRDDVMLFGVQLLAKMSRTKRFDISSIPSEVTHVEDAILPVIGAKGYGERALFGVRLALEEAVINAIKHGNELDSTKKVAIEFTIGDDRIIVCVADEGEGFDADDVPDPWAEENLEADSGRGLALMRAYMDEVRYNEKGNQVTMTMFAPWATKKPEAE